MPKEISDAMLSLADGAKPAAALAKEGMEEGDRVEHWFGSVYRSGYVHGFFRAMAYAKHHAKEGRLFRLRKLWHQTTPSEEGLYAFPASEADRAKKVAVVRMPIEVYNEIEALLELRFGVKLDAESSTDTSSPG